MQNPLADLLETLFRPPTETERLIRRAERAEFQARVLGIMVLGLLGALAYLLR